MSARRAVLFIYFSALLVVMYPTTISSQVRVPEQLPIGEKVQVDTPIGNFSIGRFPFDYQIYTYLDAYPKFFEITYISKPRMFNCDVRVPIDIPLGLCIVLDKLDRGKYIPPEITGKYYVESKFPITSINLYMLDRSTFNAFCAYWRDITPVEKTPATVENLREKVDLNDGAIYLMNGYYPVYIYGYDATSFYVYDPVERSTGLNIIVEMSGELVYRNGLLTYIGGELVTCLDS